VSRGLVHWHESVASTQDEAHRLAANAAPHGTAVAAREQTSGRGSRGRGWVSSNGGLWLSVVCRPEDVAAPESVGIRVGLAVASLLDPLLDPATRVALKWPNDLFLHDRKVGGVLAEARWQGPLLAWMVIGVGLNLSNDLSAELHGVAIRLADTGATTALPDLADAVASGVSAAARTAPPLSAEELLAFAARDWLLGRPIVHPVAGIAAGITPGGRLRIRTSSGSIAEVVDTIRLAGS
jgi:BirA family biotin operon repressor/biotin-[acetyl-CoA-carboxylase] ligase